VGARGQLTREAILATARVRAAGFGLHGLSIGALAKALDMSKSGLYAHFASKEALQLAVIDTAAAQFTDEVVTPALKTARGEARVRAVFDGWCAWLMRQETPGCLFIAAASELDDQPGPVRDHVVGHQRDLIDFLERVVGTATANGDFRADLDLAQFAFELHGLILAFHHDTRLLVDSNARERVQRGFDRLVADANAA